MKHESWLKKDSIRIFPQVVSNMNIKEKTISLFALIYMVYCNIKEKTISLFALIYMVYCIHSTIYCRDVLTRPLVAPKLRVDVMD